jgi:hypothetical protein
MLTLDDPSMENPEDPRTRLIVRMLSSKLYTSSTIAASLEVAGLSPGNYKLDNAAIYTWLAVVPDAARLGKLAALIERVIEQDAAFGVQLERQWQFLITPSGGEHGWYRHDDPYTSGFVGLRASRAVIDREGLRSGLRDLATDQYRILVVSGKPRSGKSHSWELVGHLRDAGRLGGEFQLVRVTTHAWGSDKVTGEALISSLADKLALGIVLASSGELADARIRKFLDLFVGHYPQDDGKTRWIVLDGLDLPHVEDSARDVAKRLITLVDEGELSRTRLIVTGLDTLGLTAGYTVQLEEIPAIDKMVVRTFLTDVAEDLGHPVTPEELDDCVADVLGEGELPRDLRDVERAVVQLVKARWIEGAQRGG